MTSEERRVVAEELRALYVSDLGDMGNVIDTPEESGVLFNRILEVANDYRPGLHYAMSHFVARNAVELFADLIDPTCNDFGGEEGTNGEGYDFACSACGYVCDLPQPNYCPNCGCRVVDVVRKNDR